MKYITTLVTVLTLFCHSQIYSQSNFKKQREYNKLKLQADEPKAFQKDGKTRWNVNTTLTNRSKDTLFYFTETCSETYYYSTDTTLLFVEGKSCDKNAQTVSAIPPHGQRALTLEIFPQYPVTSSIKFRVVMFVYKAKDRNERIPHDELVKRRDNSVLVLSNYIKT